jgi:hypothetical protein
MLDNIQKTKIPTPPNPIHPLLPSPKIFYLPTMPQCKNIILISLFLALAAYGQQQQRIAILGTEV